MWDVLIGAVKIGRLSDPRSENGQTVCTFQPTEAFGRFADALAVGDISGLHDETLDAVIDEIAVDGLFLVTDDGTEIVDPDLRIDGASASFTDQPSSKT